MHLGHPLPTHLSQSQGYRIVVDELRAQLLDRVAVVNTVVLPRILYRCECLPLTTPQIRELSQVLERFVLGVSGLPSLVAKKILYTHRSCGLGLRCLAVLYPTRILDTLHRNPLLSDMRTSGRTRFAPRFLFLNALSLLDPSP